ncbi:Predicted membrane protein [Amycolatopsis xylanica]|uniref:Predicted membrane protein n=1 Tax=Amycolatopsis xylanica TaxID=589385 RepID=A0A1H3SMC8_9PSEU|nr:DUF2207 domain-containing protein [Amycolatopsis xylanica]SDZ38279.1 Predicted membrane protein [Amycolatopsis xylanica]
MLTKWGPAAVLTAAAVMFPAQPDFDIPPSGGPSVPDQPDITIPRPPNGVAGRVAESQPDGPTSDLELKVGRDGKLNVTDKVKIPGGKQLVRVIPLRVPATGDQDRVFSVPEIKAEGPATFSQDADKVTITYPAGESTVRYTVDGAVADLDGGQQLRWQLASGWSEPIARVTASVIAPVRELSLVNCFAGPIGSDQQCTLAEVDHTGIVRVEHDDLKQGDRVDLSVGLPAGSVPANARFEAISGAAGAFALTTAVGIGFGLLALLLLAGALLVWRLRKRDADALAGGSGPVDVLQRDGGHVTFVSPDGVLPGQVGTVVDETVDVVDISATVVDLAVRNYLWIAEVPSGSGTVDWQLSRRNPADENLHDFERAIFEALLPDGTDTVLLSEIRSRGSLDLRKVSDAMYTDVVRKGWFARRPDSGRGLLTWVGVGLFGAGLAATIALAFSIGHALLGVALAVAGIALVLGAGWLPSRTPRGRLLVSNVRGLLDYLHNVKVEDIPPADRELVFSRSLPFAVVLGDSERWLRTFASLDPSADGSAGLYWFGGLDQERDLRRFATHFPAFLTALDGLLAESGHLRSLQPAPA